MIRNRTKNAGRLVLLVIAMIVIATIGNFAFAEDTRAIQLNNTEIEVSKGKPFKLTAKVENEKATFSWESKDESIAVVKAGTVTGKGNGSTTILCSTVLADGTSLSAECKVTVYTPVTKITAANTPGGKQTFVNVNQTSDPFEIVVTPEDATCQTVTWSSSDESIAMVDSAGRVTGKKAGKVSIIATSDDPYSGGKPRTYVFKIVVNQGAEFLKINGNVKIQKGKSEKFTIDILPEDTTNKKIAWSSSDEKVAVVTNGTVKAVGCGECIITATTMDGTNITTTYNIEVYQPITQLQPETRKLIGITKGEHKMVHVDVIPDDATIKTLTWSSSDEDIATVNSNGLVTGIKVGECIITAIANDGSNKIAEFKIAIEPILPIAVKDFWKKGYYGIYSQFGLTIKNMTLTRTIKYYNFDLEFSYEGKTVRHSRFCSSISLTPMKKITDGYWDLNAFQLTSGSGFKVYLNSVEYSDGTTKTFTKDNLIGPFIFGSVEKYGYRNFQ